MFLSDHTKNILGLHLPTDPRWVDLAGLSMEAILTDHAYCEQKAATTCITLIQKYSDREKLVFELAPIVAEEWGHFRLVLKRSFSIIRDGLNSYLMKISKWGSGCKVSNHS